MKTLTLNFFAIGHLKPTLAVKRPHVFDIWEAMSAELASYYGADAADFRVSEASWSGGDLVAEIVTLRGQIVGALNQALSQNDVTAIGGGERAEKCALINRIRSLFNIDGDLLPELTRAQQSSFLQNPVSFFLDADEAQSDAIMREIEARQPVLANSEPKRQAAPPTPVKAAATKRRKAVADGQRELLLPIAGGKTSDVKPLAKSPAGRKAG